jgi:hypothetical protein
MSGVKELRLLGNLEHICVFLSVNKETSLSLAACDSHVYSRNNVVCLIYPFTNPCLHTTEEGLRFCTHVGHVCTSHSQTLIVLNHIHRWQLYAENSAIGRGRIELICRFIGKTMFAGTSVKDIFNH